MRFALARVAAHSRVPGPLIGLAVGVSLTAATLLAQQASAPQPPSSRSQTPQELKETFRAGTDLGQIQVGVLDGHRVPVHGLKANDFTLRVDGKVRPIVALTEIEVPGPSASVSSVRDRVEEGSTPEASPHPRADGRLVVILLDRSIPWGAAATAARHIATAAINQLGPNDLAAVIYTGTGVPQNFTADRRLLLRVINGSDPSTEPSAEALAQADGVAQRVNLDASLLDAHPGACQCGLCVPETITHIAQTLRELPGRKAILHIGYDLKWQSSDGECGGRLLQAVKAMFDALDVGGVTVHSLNPVGLETPVAAAAFGSGSGGAAKSQQIMHSNQSLQVLPDRTGGRAITDTNTPESFMPQIFAESASYYVLGFADAGATAGDGAQIRSEKIQVSVNRSDTHLATQREYLAPSSLPPHAAAPAIAAAVPNLVASRAMTLRGVAAPFALPDASGAVVIVTLGLQQAIDEPVSGNDAAVVSRTDRLSVSVAAFDAYAAPKGTDSRTLEVAYRASGQGSLALEVLGRLPLKPGNYEIRGGATGTDPVDSGAVSTYLDVPDFAGDPFSLSGLVLSSPAARVVSAESVQDLLPVVPTARRIFTSQDQVTAFVRAYQGGHDTLVPAKGTVSLRDAGDQIVWERPIALEATAFGSTRSADEQIDVPIAALAAGEYVITMEFEAGGRTLSRTARITIE